MFPGLGQNLHLDLDDNLTHVVWERCMLQLACRLLDALAFLHENEYVHGRLTGEDVFVNPKDLSRVILVV